MNILIFAISCLFIASSIVATPNQEKPVIVFDFGGVVAKSDRAVLIKFFEDKG